MAATSSPQLQETPHSESVDRFLARLPSLWQQGEARPTHKARVHPPRHWRTRKDPFEGVECDVLLWPQKDPDTNAKDLLAKLREAYFAPLLWTPPPRTAAEAVCPRPRVPTESRRIRTSAPASCGRRAAPGTIRRPSRRRRCRAAGAPDGRPRGIDGAPREV